MGIFVNQIGYKKDAKKIAVVTGADKTELIDAVSGKNIKTIIAADKKSDLASGDLTGLVDFSDITECGRYYLKTDQGEASDEFVISDDTYADVLNAMIKSLYFQRCGCALDKKYADVYTHDICHADKSIFLEDYMNNTANPKEYDMTGGWHDAGDYGRYSSPAAVTIGHLLYGYELFPQCFSKELNIPESGNGIADVLNECRYEIDWLFKMQAPDGGVYHKLTAWKHADFIMPEFDKDRFLIYPVSSIATADFAAVMALIYRVYISVDEDLANRALEAARLSFDWLTKNDYIGFHNPAGSNTGEYDDDDDADERMWAAAELLRSDKNGNVDSYRDMLSKYVHSDIPKTDLGWTDVAGFAMLSIITDPDKSAGDEIYNLMFNEMIKEADRLLSIRKDSGYLLAMLPEDYVWGSNMVVTNRGVLLALAAKYSDNSEYMDAAFDTFHYLLGRNALNRSYVTRFGAHAYMNPHNRTSASDGIELPMAGWVSGGPFKAPVDEAAKQIIPAGTPPMKCHADHIGSYSTNEITIYWNSSAVLLAAFLSE